MPAQSVNSRELAAAVRQNALTSRLMGVDFVPVFRSRQAVAGAAVADLPEEPQVEMKPVPAPAVAAPMAAPTAARRGRVPSPEPTPPPAPAPAATESSLVPPLAAADYTDDPRRAGALAALQQIREQYDADAPHQHFVTDHHSIVFGEGDPCARLVFVGEAPGADEDRTGRPFVGRAGQLLTKMINAMGLKREQVYITNVLKTRPPNNATPTLDEARLCAPYLYRQLAVIRPEVIVTLGLPATRLLLQTDQSMSAMRGRWFEFIHENDRIPVMPTYHPAYLLRAYTKDNREKVWSDLQQVMQRIGLAAGAAMPGE
jgi:uracil-DNA glycosylase family 4